MSLPVSEVLFIDTETGGLNPETDALLSIGMVHWRDGEILGTREILVQSGSRVVTSRAIEVNKIVLRTHNANAMSRRSAAELFYRTCENWFPEHSKKNRITLGGHNIGFDINFIRPLFGDRWADTYSHAFIDTSSVFALLWHSGRVPGELRSLDQGLRHFGISVEAQARHTALGDALGTAKLWTAVVESLKQPRDLFGYADAPVPEDLEPRKNKGRLEDARKLIGELAAIGASATVASVR